MSTAARMPSDPTTAHDPRDSGAPVLHGAARTLKSIAPPRSPYLTQFYCARCARWLPREKAVRDRNGRLICPHCGNMLRVRPHNREHRWRFPRLNAEEVVANE